VLRFVFVFEIYGLHTPIQTYCSNMLNLFARILAVLFAFAVIGGSCKTTVAKFDVVLRNGTVYDGSGGPPREGSVAIADGKIVSIGDIGTQSADKTIDCKGFVIAPGFIDLHNHSDDTTLNGEARKAHCYLTQGCTTLVTGNCGGGRVDIGKFYDDLAAGGVGINIAHLIPQGEVRDRVIGKVRRAPTAEELRKMRALVAEGMEQGAWGMSTGLQYVPGSFAKLDELASLAQVAGEHGGIYASHIRDEGDDLLESVQEAIDIARGGNLPCHISHLKASKKPNWGKVHAAAHLIEEAQKSGLRVTADQYPYTASSTTMMALLLPDAEREGGEVATAERLRDAEQVKRLRPIVARSIESRGPLMLATYKPNSKWVGRTIAEIAAAEKRETVEIGLEILREDPDAAGVNFGMDEADVRYVMMLPWVATASDGSAKVADGSRPHPRSFGTFSRKIGRYAIQEKVLPLAAAIRSASGLPADILGMRDRGYLRENLVADVVVFDPQQFLDQATYEKPFEPSTGVRWLILNGKVAIADGKPRDVMAGKPLRKRVESAGGKAK
jgi:N-acyl-D-amino-acid deacylase